MNNSVRKFTVTVPRAAPPVVAAQQPPQATTPVASAVAKGFVSVKAPTFGDGNVRDSAYPFAENLRAGSNLRITRTFNPQDKSKGSMWFYSCQAKYGTHTNTVFLWSTLLLAIMFPTETQGKPKKAALRAKSFRQVMTGLKGAFTQSDMADYTSVKPDASGYIVESPICWLPANIHARFVQDHAQDEPVRRRADDVVVLPTTSDEDRFYSPSELLRLPGVQSGIAIGIVQRLAQIPGAGLRVRKVNSLYKIAGGAYRDDGYLLSVRLHFDKRQLSIMCQTDYTQIRPLDVYGLMRNLTASRMGASGRPALYSMALTRIAATLPKGGRPRLSKDLGLGIDEQGKIWWVPEREPDVAGYEAQEVEYLRRADGSFSATPLKDEDTSNRHKPKPRLIMADWVNLKMSYVGSGGTAIVADTDRWVPCTALHYVEELHKPLGSQEFQQAWAKIGNIGTSVLELAPIGDFKPVLTRVFEELVKRDGPEIRAGEVSLLDMVAFRADIPAVDHFLTVCSLIVSYANHSEANLYEKYSFETISHLVGLAKILTVKGPDYENVRKEAAEILAPYRDQSVDMSYRLPKLPYLSQDTDNPRALQPHQFRAASIQRFDPSFTILGVDAGGGKTIQGLVNYLKLIALGKVRRALFMCPRHLIAQYIQEIKFLTDSQINSVVVNTHTIQTYGMRGVMEMILRAPHNTIVLLDYDLANGQKSFQICYGNQVTIAYPLTDMLRMFEFDLVMLDESHTVRNWYAKQTKATSRLVVDIPRKVLASGTLTPKVITDLVSQTCLMDPSIFPQGDFEDKYRKEVTRKGRKIQVWDADAIKARLRERVTFIRVSRMEWAAWLPALNERAHVAHMTERQQECYNHILQEEFEKIKAEIARNPALRKFLTGGSDDYFAEWSEESSDADDSDEPQDIDAAAASEQDDPVEDNEFQMFMPEDGVNVENLLNPMLHRLESFASAPGLDEYGKLVLSGDDLIPPKVHYIAARCSKALGYEFDRSDILNPPLDETGEPIADFYRGKEGVPEIDGKPFTGKILIFCNYNQEVEGIVQALKQCYPRIYDTLIHYTADNKVRDCARFENDPTKRIMIGIEVSLNTGRNLQFCEMLIRNSSVWTPGALEQGNSRVLRPNIKVRETRREVQLEWVVCNRSLDIAKQAFLLTRLMHIARFENTGNPRWATFSPPALISMSLDNIRACLNQDVEEIMDVYESYREYKTYQAEDYAEWRATHQHEVGPDGRPLMYLLERADPLPQARLMYTQPFVPGLELYGSEDIGLSRYDFFHRLDESILQVDEDSDPQGAYEERAKIELEAMLNRPVFTAFGTGYITRVNKNTVRVNLGTKEITVPKLSCFVVTKAHPNGTDLRWLQLSQINPNIPIDTTPEEIARFRRGPSAPNLEAQPVDDTGPIKINLKMLNVNGHLCLQLSGARSNRRAATYLETKNFTAPPEMLFAEIPNATTLRSLLATWARNKFTLEKKHSGYVTDFLNSLSQGTDYATLIENHRFPNFFRENHKPEPDTRTIRPTPLVVNGSRLRLALPVTGHPGSNTAFRTPSPGVTWFKVDSSDIRQLFASYNDLVSVIKSIQADGVEITNIENLRAEAKALQSVPSLV